MAASPKTVVVPVSPALAAANQISREHWRTAAFHTLWSVADADTRTRIAMGGSAKFVREASTFYAPHAFESDDLHWIFDRFKHAWATDVLERLPITTKTSIA